MVTRAIISSFILILFSVSTSYSDTSKPLRITIYPSKIQEFGLGSKKIIISKEEISKTSAKSIPELLSLYSGIQNISLYGGVDGSKSSLVIDGFGGENLAATNVAIFVDGKRFNNISMGSVNFGNVPLEQIERIEVIKGSGAGLIFGDGAVAGAVNIITKKDFVLDEKFVLQQDIGSFDQKSTNLNFTKKYDQYSFQISSKNVRSDQYRDNNKYKLENFSLKTSKKFDDGVTNYFLTSFSNEDLELPGGITEAVFLSDPKTPQYPGSYMNEDNLSYEYGYNNLRFGDFNSNFSISYKDSEVNALNDYGSSIYFNIYDYETYQIYKAFYKRSELMGKSFYSSFGFDYYDASYSNKRILPSLTKFTAEQLTYDFWGISQISYNPTIDFEIGYRTHNYEVDTFNALTNAKLFSKDSSSEAWSFGLEKKLNASSMIKGKYSKSFRAPKIDEVLETSGQTVEIEHQDSNTLELIYEKIFDNFSYNIRGYQTKVDNLIYYDSSTFDNDNYDPLTNEGYDTNFKYFDTDFVADLNLSYVSSEFDSGTYKNKKVPMVAEWSSNLKLQYSIYPELRLYFDNQFVGSRYRLGDESNIQKKAMSYVVSDIGLNYNLNNIKVSFKIDNLFDKNYYHYNSYGTLYPLPGINYVGAISYEF